MRTDTRRERSISPSSKRHLRQEIVTLLRDGDFQGLTELAGKNTGVAAILMQFFYDPGDLLHWRALEGLGYVAGSHPEPQTGGKVDAAAFVEERGLKVGERFSEQG